ncbi:MAG: HAD-IB family hydrolase [Actinomycetales bacterium]|nr:HAD-IB family hydrolase [Actinomycetales bacterium]
MSAVGAPGDRVAAFFDLDGTLIPGSVNIPLAKAAFKAGFVSKRELALDLIRNVSFMLRGVSDTGSAKVRDRILRGVQGQRADDVVGLADGFLDELVMTITPAMREILDEHRAAGHDLVLISASPTEVVQRFAIAAGMDYGTGTTAGRDADGRFDGTLVGPFCYKEGKAEVMRGLAAEHGYDLARCFAYSDSVSDEPMLAIVGNPVAVNPDHELRLMALAGGWRVVEVGRLRVGVARLQRAIRGAATSPGKAFARSRQSVSCRRATWAELRAGSPSELGIDGPTSASVAAIREPD